MDRERLARVTRDYHDYHLVLRAEQRRTRLCGPHCDHWVCHAPGVCTDCDHFPRLQQARRDLHIAYTGQIPGLGERPCPATVLRPLTVINRWHGNIDQIYTSDASALPDADEAPVAYDSPTTPTKRQ